MKIKRILIANRGEIALRVIKTCKKLGIETISLYAADDEFLPHAKAATINVALGRGALSETYLNQDKILEIAKSFEADAIHPGYGFLSENSEFCKKVSKQGLIFIGPSVEAIELMGDKKTSKVKMEDLDVPLIPGYHGDEQDPSFLLAEAKKIGYPVLIKATAGGGGKGMRIVESESDFISALEASQREAQNAFSNSKVLIEKYITKPRHIEVQLVSDAQGGHYHFFERECSIQRRYQKIVEETPSVALDEKLRKNICETAVRISSGINYIGAGTIEFILSPDGSFYFLEMNTRLQVEHPITEMVTGFDLVELQIRAAQGEKFDFSQDDIKQRGHAIECRIYAEDPDKGFLPTNGRIQKIESNPLVHYRLDIGLKDFNEISTQYDPMLAKLIVHADSRHEATDKMIKALSSVPFGGVKTNRDYLRRVLENNAFVAGKTHTHFVVEQEEALKPMNLPIHHFIASLLVQNISSQKSVWDHVNPYTQTLFIEDNEYHIHVLGLNSSEIIFEFLGQKYCYQLVDNKLMYDGELLDISIFDFDQTGLKQIFVGPYEFFGKLEAKAKRQNLSVLAAGSLQSPMPGKIFKILKSTGDKITKGEPILILEAMKMEHSIRAPHDGVLKEIFFKEGEQVRGGVALCDIE